VGFEFIKWIEKNHRSARHQCYKIILGDIKEFRGKREIVINSIFMFL